MRGSGREIGLLDESAAVMRRVRSSLAAIAEEEEVSSVKWILMTSVIRASAVSPMLLGAGAEECLR